MRKLNLLKPRIKQTPPANSQRTWVRSPAAAHARAQTGNALMRVLTSTPAITCSLLLILTPLLMWLEKILAGAAEGSPSPWSLALILSLSFTVLWQLAWVALAGATRLSWIPKRARHFTEGLVRRRGSTLARRIVLAGTSSLTVGTMLLPAAHADSAPELWPELAATVAETVSEEPAADVLPLWVPLELPVEKPAPKPENSRTVHLPAAPVATPAPTPEVQTPPVNLEAMPPPQTQTQTLNVPKLPPRETHTVVPGDTLWDIAAAGLDAADLHAIDEAWQELYRLNLQAVGNDPNLLHPGTTLTLVSPQP